MSDLAEQVRTMPCVCSPRVGPGWVETRLAVLAAVRALDTEVAALRRVRERAQELAAALAVSSYRMPPHAVAALDALVAAIEEAARG